MALVKEKNQNNGPFIIEKAKVNPLDKKLTHINKTMSFKKTLCEPSIIVSVMNGFP